MSGKALLVIDVQNDYFPSGKFPLWNTEKTIENINSAVQLALQNKVHIIEIQHVAKSEFAPKPNSSNGENESAVRVVIKEYADSFHLTNLEQTLDELNVKEILVCGMMTQNCVTHTAISKTAEKYEKVSIITDCCTTVSEMLHNIALHAVSTRITLVPFSSAFQQSIILNSVVVIIEGKLVVVIG